MIPKLESFDANAIEYVICLMDPLLSWMCRKNLVPNNFKGIISTKSIVQNVKTESRSRRRPLKMIGCGTLRPLLCGVLDLDRSYLETRLEVKWASDS